MRPLMTRGGASGETGKNKQKLDDDRRWFLIIGILSDKVDGISPVKREKTSPSTISVKIIHIISLILTIIDVREVFR